MITVTMQFGNPQEVVAFFGYPRLNEVVGNEAPAVTLNDGGTVAAATPVGQLDTLLALLNDEKYEYRKASTLAEAIGSTEDGVLELLNKEGIDYDTLRQRGSGALLIGIK